MFELHHFQTQSNTLRRPPVLMVPGAFCNAKVWHQDFIASFRQQGHPVYTLTFSGHGSRRLRKSVRGLADYIQDLDDAIQQIGEAPLLIAHSLGGRVAMQYLAQLQAAGKQTLPGAALLAPAPLKSMNRTLLGYLRKHPVSAFKLMGLTLEPRVRYLGEAPAGIYSDTCCPELKNVTTRQLGAESPRTLLQLLSDFDVEAEQIGTPMHFFAATGDHLIPAHTTEDLAAFFDAPVTVYEGMSHSFQAERDWPRVAQDIQRWFEYCQSSEKSGDTSVQSGKYEVGKSGLVGRSEKSDF